LSGTELILRLVGAVVVAYLLGGVPTGVLIGKIYGVDPREGGSGKTGTTNVLRTLGPRAAILVLVGDLLKGVIAVLLARYVFFNPALFHVTSTAAAQALQTWRPGRRRWRVSRRCNHTCSPYIGFKVGAWRPAAARC
jgi:acyl-phosphate glycerol 3-phosphate acyltransferase